MVGPRGGAAMTKRVGSSRRVLLVDDVRLTSAFPVWVVSSHNLTLCASDRPDSPEITRSTKRALEKTGDLMEVAKPQRLEPDLTPRPNTRS